MKELIIIIIIIITRKKHLIGGSNYSNSNFNITLSFYGFLTLLFVKY